MFFTSSNTEHNKEDLFANLKMRQK